MKTKQSDAVRRRVLYFDIDGVLLDYSDKPKSALAGGNLPSLLEALGFQQLVCLSGWCDAIAEPVAGIPPAERIAALHAIIAPVFPDLDWFKAHVVLTNDTDHRCRNINLTEDWAYVDDWADKFFTEQFGIEPYQQFLGKRILLCDPYADGSDIVHWLEAFPSL